MAFPFAFHIISCMEVTVGILGGSLSVRLTLQHLALVLASGRECIITDFYLLCVYNMRTEQ